MAETIIERTNLASESRRAHNVENSTDAPSGIGTIETLSDFLRKREGLISLLDLVVWMENGYFDIEKVTQLIHLSSHADGGSSGDIFKILESSTDADNEELVSFCQEMDLPTTAHILAEMVTFRKDYPDAPRSYDDFDNSNSNEVYEYNSKVRRFTDIFSFNLRSEISRHKLLWLKGQSDLWEKPLGEFSSINSALPEECEFMSQANRCIAIGLSSASVYFLLGAVDLALHRLPALVTGLIPPPDGKQVWGNWIKQLQMYAVKTQFKDHQGRQAWKEPPYYSEISQVNGYLMSIKFTRDNISHPGLNPLMKYEDREVLPIKTSVVLILEAVAKIVIHQSPSLGY